MGKALAMLTLCGYGCGKTAKPIVLFQVNLLVMEPCILANDYWILRNNCMTWVVSKVG